MKPTLWYVTLLYFISIQQFNLQISKHTPNQENYFSYHISTTFLSLWHLSMRYQTLNRRKCCPLFSIHWLQHLFTGKANLCYKYLHLLTTTCPDSQPTEVPGWELGEDAGFRFQAPWEGGTWSAVVTCSLFVQVSHHYLCLHLTKDMCEEAKGVLRGLLGKKWEKKYSRIISYFVYLMLL